MWRSNVFIGTSHDSQMKGPGLPFWGRGRAGSGVVRIDPLRFVAGFRTRRLNQALSVLSFSLDFLIVSVCAVNDMARFYVVILCNL